MQTGDTRKHIDTARDILVGKVPDPKQQIDQITNALIYKFMDDMDAQAIDAGGQASFFTGELEQYAWHKLMNPKIGAQERLNIYTEALEKFSTAQTLPQLFRDIFRQAFLPYRSPETLDMFLKEIEYFDYSHSENLGNAFEYLLSIMGAQGDAGQFRTPRHIIDFMVEVINPGKDDRILDPACGTAGFLISAYKHILSQHDGLDDETGEPAPDESKLSHGDKQKLLNDLEGYDISSGMVKLARVNMYLHGNHQPKIYEYDSLSSEQRWDDTFDVILANPPFMSPKGGIRPHKKFGVESSRTEVLFVDYIASHLKLGGRAAVIVPEGIIFSSGKAYKNLRKMLVEDHYLAGVVSLPAGVFNPYAGVKTSILWLDKDLAKKKQEIVFAKVENDGLSHGTRRHPIEQNDLPEIAEALKLWAGGAEVASPHITTVPKSKLKDSGDYNLSANRYVEVKETANQKWPMAKLEDVTTLIQRGKSPKYGDSKVQVIKSGQARGYYSFDFTKQYFVDKDFKLDQRKLEANDLLINSTGVGTAGRVTLFNLEGNYLVDGHITIVRLDQSKALPIYVLYSLAVGYGFQKIEAMAQGNGGQIELSLTTIKNLQIPLPPIEEQQKIVDEIENKQKAIDHAREIIKSLERERDAILTRSLAPKPKTGQS